MLAAICLRAAPAAPSAVACIVQRPAQLLLDHGFSFQAAPQPSGPDAAAEGVSEAGGADAQIVERRASHQQASTSGGPIYDKGFSHQHAVQWQQRQHLQTMTTTPSAVGLSALARGVYMPQQQQQQQQVEEFVDDTEAREMLGQLRYSEALPEALLLQQQQQQQQQQLWPWQLQPQPLQQQQQQQQQPPRVNSLDKRGVSALLGQLGYGEVQQQQQLSPWQHQPQPLEQQQQGQAQAPEATTSRTQQLERLMQDVQQQAGDTATVDTSLYKALFSISQALDVDPWPHLVPLARRCVHHLSCTKKQAVWASGKVAATTADALLEHTTLDADAVVALLARRPSCLVAGRTEGVPAVLQQLRTELGLTPKQLRQMVRAAPALLELTPEVLAQQLGYLCGEGALGLSQQQAAGAVAANPRLLVVPHTCWSASVAFLVGLGLSSDTVRALLVAAPTLATAPLKQLILRWNYLRAELKGSVEDLAMAPQLLLSDLQRTLGPRTSFVRKQHFMLLLPSHTMGAPILLRPASWKQYKMVPLTQLLSMSAERLCLLLGVHGAEFELYKQAWQATEGKRWSRYTLDAGRPLGTVGEHELALSQLGLCPEVGQQALQGQQQAGRSMLLLQELPRKSKGRVRSTK